jgi:hypothetical protein
MTAKQQDTLPAGGGDVVESAVHEAGHVFVCLAGGATIEFARAGTAGPGTSRLVDPKSHPPDFAARIAVAGRSSEEVLLGISRRNLPVNDGYLLAWARDALGDGFDEDRTRDEVVAYLGANEPVVRAIADELQAHADSDVPARRLREIYDITNRVG